MRRQAVRRVQPAQRVADPEPDDDHQVEAQIPCGLEFEGVDVVEAGSPVEPFEEFYLREFPHLRLLALALVDPGFADDVAQEALLVAYRRWRTVGRLRSPAGYVRGICAHKAVTWTRRRTRERQLLARAGAWRPEPDQPGNGDALEDDVFWAQIRGLPTRQAQCAALHYALDLPVVEVAEVLGCSEGTVKTHLYRARAALAAALDVSEE
jgi:RNA polymerase sigma-70 factor, ECF subfamily